MSTLITLVILAAIVAFLALRKGETLRFETTTDPHRVIVAAVGIVGARRLWETISQSDRDANFRYHRRPNPLIALALLLCFVAPGVVYLVLAGKRESLVINIDTATNGMTVVQAASNGYRGKSAARALARQVRLPAGSLGGPPMPALKQR